MRNGTSRTLVFREVDLLESKRVCACGQPADFYCKIVDYSAENRGIYEFYDCAVHAVRREKIYEGDSEHEGLGNLW